MRPRTASRRSVKALAVAVGLIVLGREAAAQTSLAGPVLTQIAAGDDHTCALTTSGGVRCWGFNGEGQLGDGTTTDRSTPVDVVGLGGGVAAIAPGGSHTCALTTGGGVKCWGANFAGQLGDGTQAQRLTPVNVSGLTSGVAAISAGEYHTCALTTGGGMKCWGYNTDGQLGDGTTTGRLIPTAVSGLAIGVVHIAVGKFHLRGDHGRRSEMLGLQQRRPGGRRRDHRSYRSRGCEHPAERRRKSGRGRLSHLRPDRERGREMLGPQQRGPVGRWHGVRSPHSR